MEQPCHTSLVMSVIRRAKITSLFHFGAGVLALSALGAALVSNPAAAAPPTTVPDEGPAAGIVCPVVGTLPPLERQVRLSDDGGDLECRYVSDGSNAYNITVSWVRVGGPPGRFCSKSEGDIDLTRDESVNSIYDVRSGVTSTEASVNILKEGAVEPVAVWAAAAASLIPLFDPFAEPCAPEYVCPPTIGSLTFDDWLETGTAKIYTSADITEATCAYRPPDDSVDVTSARLTVHYASAQSPASSKVTQCSAIDEFKGGFVRVDGPDSLAIRGVIDLSVPSLTYDLAALRTELDAMLATFAPSAASCEGVPEANLYSPLPQWLADVWDISYSTGQPTLLLTPGGSESLVAPAAPAPVETTVAPPTETTAPDPTVAPTTESATTTGPAPTTTAVAAAPTSTPSSAAPAAAAAAPGPSSGGFPGWVQMVMRIFGWIALPLSILGVALALFMLKRESRVRPKLDVVRIAIMVVVAGVTTFVLGRSTPLWVFPVAIALGGALGLVQGRNLDVRVADDRLMAKRSRWAMIAFVIGLACSQLSGLLGRVGILSVGIGLTMLSAALAAGITIGRRPKIRDARASMATVVVLLFVSAPALAMIAGGAAPAVDTARAQEDETEPAPVDEEPPPMPALTTDDFLDGMIDWTTLELDSGYDGVGTGKPLVEVTLPLGLASIPEPIEINSSWALPWAGEEFAYNLAETYTLSALDDGTCCAVDYAASGTEQHGDRAIEVVTAQADLGALTRLSGGFGTVNPFGAAEILDDETCGRQVLRSRRIGETDPAWSVLTVGDSDSSGREAPEVAVYTECELPDFTVSAALDRAPNPPELNAEARVDFAGTVCPVHQEVMATFGQAPRYNDQAATSDLLDLFREPNAPRCSGSAYVGDERKGGVRNEFQFQLASVDPETESQRQRSIVETFGDRRLPHEIGEELQCDVAANGVPQQRADQNFCLNRTYHQVGDGEITIWTNTDIADGPDTTIRGNFPWGNYFYNCHHCDVGDPYIADVLNTWHQFAQEWNANGVAPSPEADAEFAEPAADAEEALGVETPDEPGADVETEEDTDENAETEEAIEGDDTEPTTGPGDTDAPADSDDDGVDAEDVAAIALVSLLGAAGLAGTSIAESGHSATELLDAYRNGGLERLGDLLETDLEPRESPDDPVRGWDPGREEFRDMTRAERDRLDGVDRDLRREDRLESDAELLADIRADRARMDAAADRLQRRDELEAGLLESEAEQDRWADPAQMRQAILDDAFDNILRETDGLPDELRGAAQAVNQVMNDPATWDALEAYAARTAYDAAGMISPIEFGDGRQRATAFGQMIGEAFAADPVGFLAQMTPLGDLSDSLDGERTLGQRLGSLGLALSDLFPTMAGASMARDAVNLTDAARDLERATEAARAAERASDFGEFSSDAGRLAAEGHETRRRLALGDSLDEIAHAGGPKGSGRVIDTIEEQITRNRSSLGDDLGSPAEQARRIAWERNQRVGAGTVDDFAQQVSRPVDLDTESIADINAALREEALRVQTNKNALQQIKNQPEDVQRVFVNQMREVYNDTDDAVLDWATDYINKQQGGRLGDVQIQGDLRIDRIEGGRTVFVDDIGNEIQLFEPTNAAPGQISVGADRDFTAYVKPAGSDGPAFSLPRDEVGPVYRDSFYDAIGGDEMRERLGIPEVTPDDVLEEARRLGVDPPGDPVEAARRRTVDRVAERFDQAVTDDFDPEAYTNVHTTLHRPFGELGDAQQVGLTATYKGDEWAWRAEHSLDEAGRLRPDADNAGGGLSWSELSEDQRSDGLRQIVKQNGNQVQPRLEELQRQTQYLIDQGKLPPKSPIPQPDTRLDAAVKIMDRVKREGLSPVDMERELMRTTNMTPSEVARLNGERIHVMEQMRPPEVAELQQRMGRVADQLEIELKDMPNPKDRIPTSQQVWERVLEEDTATPWGTS